MRTLTLRVWIAVRLQLVQMYLWDQMCHFLPRCIRSAGRIAGNVTICGGVTIGEGCVIGAGSVVTRDIPANSLAVGVPCRVIREITEEDALENHPELF